MTAVEKLKEVSAFLKSKGIEDAAKEAEIFITETLQIDKSKLYASDLEISDEISRQIDSLALRRAKGEPIQYIIGYVEFYGLKINVGRGVLIPRPETELLVEEAIKILYSRITHNASRITILDLCTGSGCIAIAIAKQFPDAFVWGVDKSDIAISYALKNAMRNNAKNVQFLKGDLWWPVKDMRFDLIVSNPPYIKTTEIPKLQREIRDYEPIDALDGGEDGLYFYRKILKDSPLFLKENGVIVLELGYSLGDDVKKIAFKEGFKNVTLIRDYSNIERIAVIKNYGINSLFY